MILKKKKKFSPKAVKHCLGNSEVGDLFNICVITIVLCNPTDTVQYNDSKHQTNYQPHAEFPIQAN